MDIKKIQELIKLVEKSSTISELSIEEKGFKFHLKLTNGISTVVCQEKAPNYITVPSSGSAPAHSEVSAPQKSSPEKKVKHILSPIVGTFYSKASPDMPPYVKVGDTVTAKTIVCIIESMKVFNEIESEQSGKIVEVLVKDGSPVEHGQPLFVVE